MQMARHHMSMPHILQLQALDAVALAMETVAARELQLTAVADDASGVEFEERQLSPGPGHGFLGCEREARRGKKIDDVSSSESSPVTSALTHCSRSDRSTSIVLSLDQRALDGLEGHDKDLP